MNDLKSALRTRLTAATALTALLSGTAAVYHGIALTGATLPYVVYTIATDTELNVTPSREREFLVDVKAIAANADTAGNIEIQIHTAMSTDVSVTGWGVVNQKRERGISLREEDSGKVYFHEGGTYRIRLEQV